jgi:GNAT superfamily N-acetyltransferase
MPSIISIRRATLVDIDTLVHNNIAMASETEDRALPEAVVRPGVRRVLTDPGLGVYHLAFLDQTPAGQMLITFEWSDWRNGLFWWIQSVYVTPTLRGRGIYRALHEHVTRLAREDGHVCGLRLYVDRDNAAARRVYEHLGMRSTNYDLMETEWSPDGR